MHSFLSKKLKVAGFAFLLIILSACTQLGSSSNAKINFNLNLSRAARSVFKSSDSAFVTVELKGGVEDSQTVEIKEGETVDFTFEEIPVGTELYAQIEIYIFVEKTSEGSETAEKEKVVLYSGKSETKTIAEGTNEIKITLEKLFEDEEEDEDEKEKEEIKFNIVTKTDTTYTVENPTFTIEWDKALEKSVPLSTNEISFNSEKEYEAFIWKPADSNISFTEYQKVKITYKGTTLKADEENVIAFKARRALTRNYYRDQKPVTEESQTYEMDIPQGKGPLWLGIENKWDSSKKSFQGDFTFAVEKIELIKDASLAIDYSKSTYTVEGTNIELLRNINNDADWSVGRNTIKYTSKEYEQNGNTGGWAAAYWEFDRLSEYNKAVITVKGLNPNSYGMKFTIGGEISWYKRAEIGEIEADQHSKESEYVTLGNENVSKTIEVNLADFVICDNDGGTGVATSFSPVAIEFINQSYEGSWGSDMVWGDDWTLVIEKIELKKTEPELFGYKTISINNNWHSSIFNEYRDIFTLKSATTDSITFTVNHALTQGEEETGMLQVVFGDSYYDAGKMYVCSYKIKGPDTNTMNVCAWVPRDETYTNGTQANLMSDYDNTGFTEHSFIIPCDASNTGGILLFPETPGEYTISDVSVTTNVKRDVSLSIELPENDSSDIAVTVTKDGTEVTSSGAFTATNTSSIVFTAEPGYDSYIWKIDGEEKLNRTNTYTLILADAETGAVYDITLLAHKTDADGDDVYHSYSAQVQVTIE